MTVTYTEVTRINIWVVIAYTCTHRGKIFCSVCSLSSMEFYEMLYKGWSLKYCLMIASVQLPIPPLVIVLTDPFHHWSWCWPTHSTMSHPFHQWSWCWPTHSASGHGIDPPIPPMVMVVTHPFHHWSWCWPTHSTSGHGVDPPIIPVVMVLTHPLYQWPWCWPTHYTSGHCVDPLSGPGKGAKRRELKGVLFSSLTVSMDLL